MTSNVPDTERAGPRFQIGEVADRTGVTQRTLRFYEEKGLLKPPERMDGGFRLYSEEDVQRIDYIRRLQELLGFTLAEIKEMVDAEELRQQIISTFRPDRELPARLARIDTIIEALTRQLDVVEHKVEHLSTMREDLRGKMERMQQRRAEIVVALDDEKSGKPRA